MNRFKGNYKRLKRGLTSPLVKHNNNRLGALLWDDESFNPTDNYIVSSHTLVIIIIILILLALFGATVYFYRIEEKHSVLIILNRDFSSIFFLSFIPKAVDIKVQTPSS